MNPLHFGKIIKSLRKEQIHYQSGRFWTQKDLAKATNLSEKIIGNIEQGRRANLTGMELRKLADALRLTTLERHEFFAASMEMEQTDNLLHQHDIKQSFDYIWAHFSKIQLPAYLIDPLTSLIGINESMMLFHGISSEMLENARQGDIGCNILRLFFRPNSPLKTAMGERWYEPARSNIHQFQFTSLRYWHTKQFKRMLAQMHEYPQFTQLWQQSREHTMETFSLIRVFDYTHIKHGTVHYATSITPTFTPCGPLYTVIFIPCNLKTKDVFRDLSNDLTDARQIMSWPDEKLNCTI